MTLSTCIKQTSVFCEGPIFLVLIARFTAGHFFYDVAPSPAVCCRHSNRKKKKKTGFVVSPKHVRTVHFETSDKQRTLWNYIETECSGQTEGNCGRSTVFSSRHSIKLWYHFNSLMTCVCVSCVCDPSALVWHLILNAGEDAAGQENKWTRER